MGAVRNVPVDATPDGRSWPAIVSMRKRSDGATSTPKLWVTSGAGANVALPPWLAVMEQTPSATRVTVVPEIVHTPVLIEVKATESPELALALTVNGADPTVRLGSALNVMVWVVNAATLINTLCWSAEMDSVKVNP